MKKLLTGILALSALTALAKGQPIYHHNCNLWISTEHPHGKLYISEAEAEVKKLSLKGYTARFGNFGGDYQEELILSLQERVVRSPSMLRDGKANLKLQILDLVSSTSQRPLYIDETTVECSFVKDGSLGTLKKYNNDCTPKMLQRLQQLPECHVAL